MKAKLLESRSALVMRSAAAASVELSYAIADSNERWVLKEETMPESELHDAILYLLASILLAWRSREGRNALIARNRAVRWNRQFPRQGIDPDVCVIEPAPPEAEDLTSLCTWKKGHMPPRLAIEVVSEDKDYGDGPDRYAASGTRELWVFDPLLLGPDLRGGPCVLQVWRRDSKRGFRRIYAGPGPARSEELGAWVVVTDGGRRLRIADDPKGAKRWPTEAEAEAARAEAEVARLKKEIARLRAKA